MNCLSRLPEEIKDSIERRLNEIKNLRGVEKIIIFGSYAKGTNQPSSDIDIAVFSIRMTACFESSIGRYLKYAPAPKSTFRCRLFFQAN
jgi:Predicted nucleotidyltransferases